VRVLEGASISYRKAASYQPLIGLLRAYFTIERGDDLDAIRKKVADELLALDRALAPDISALLALLDVPVEEPLWTNLDSSQRRQRTLDALKRLFLREAERQSVILAIEDLHWIDSQTQAFLAALIDSLASAPLMLILTYRPEYEHHWGGKSYYSQIRLDTLSPETAEEFVRSLVGDDVSLARVKELLPKHGTGLAREKWRDFLIALDATGGPDEQTRETDIHRRVQAGGSAADRNQRSNERPGSRRFGTWPFDPDTLEAAIPGSGSAGRSARGYGEGTGTAAQGERAPTPRA
jgi:hypothetical protein